MDDLETYSPSLRKLVGELSKLPSVGRKTAQRLAYYLVRSDDAVSNALASAIREAHEKVKLCEKCFFITEDSLCRICSANNRDTTLLCVVEKPIDVISIEKGGEYRGHYHVLHGLWAPLRGMGPADMKVQELRERLVCDDVSEVILALGATVEGDATALYIAKIVNEFGIACSRLAQGLPKGGEIEFADEATVAHAFRGRKAIG